MKEKVYIHVKVTGLDAPSHPTHNLIKRGKPFNSGSEITSSQQEVDALSKFNTLLFIFPYVDLAGELDTPTSLSHDTDSHKTDVPLFLGLLRQAEAA